VEVLGFYLLGEVSGYGGLMSESGEAVGTRSLAVLGYGAGCD
jgi:hypothetical protein